MRAVSDAVTAVDVPYLRVGSTELFARIYRPEGTGPFPTVLDVHGGVWSGGDRTSDAVYCGALAERGILVVSTDHRTAPAHPYPAQVADQNLAVRWLKANAAKFGGDASRVGAIGSSSGGHTVLLNAMRPGDPRYAAHPLEGATPVDALLSYVIAFSPVVAPVARYEYALSRRVAARPADGGRLEERTLAYFRTEGAMAEGDPQRILDRGESVHTPPLLVLHPTVDANVPQPLIERFVASYRAAGGEVEVHWFDGVGHGFARSPGPATERAVGLIADFVARHRPGRRRPPSAVS